jgi:hypothetical protein
LQPNGFVTNCQTAASAPGASYTAKAPRTPPTATSSGTVNIDSQPFCVGAFLLAGSAVAALDNSPGKIVTLSGAFPSAVTIDLGANYRLSNAMVVPYLDRAYRYRIDTSTDNVHWTLVVDRTTNTATGSRLDDFTGGTVNARYARLTVTGVYGVVTNVANIQGFAVYDRYAPRVDLARGKPTAGSSTLSGFPATNATDGSSTTWWSSAAVPTASIGQTLLVDLGAITPINAVRVFSRAGAGPRHIIVSVKASGSTYTTVASVDLPNAEGPGTVVFPAINARWVRVSTNSSYSTSTVSVEQLEVFKSP